MALSIVSRVRLGVLWIIVGSMGAFAQLNSSRGAIDSIVQQARGVVGVAAIDLTTGDTLTVRGANRFPMQSVFKFPLALTVLDRVDKGMFSLARAVHISKTDLLADTWSPIRDVYPSGEIDLPLDSLLRYTVSLSDNNACDILFRFLGGTSPVDNYVHRFGITDISIVATEEEMHQKWETQYRNWCTPLAMARMLQLFHNGSILSMESRDYLWRIMVGTTTAPGRIRGLLPSEAVVAHKSGSSGRNEQGIVAATNDAGIVEFPNGRRVALAVFVSESDASDRENDAVIAAVARAIWDAYTTGK